MSTTLKVLNAKTVIAEHKIKQGETLTLAAKVEANYQLIDDKTGFGPENIITKREDNDLKIFLKDGDVKEDIVIKDYYDEEAGKETSNLLIGQADNGKIYAYIPESGVKTDAVSLLADQVAAPQILGGDELASAFWAFNPWWLAALVPLAAGITIAASNSGGSSGNNNGSNNEEPDNTAPVKAAKNAVAAAEKAASDLDKAIAEAQKGGLTAEEKSKLDEQAKEADALKDAAKAAVDALPDTSTDKTDLTTRVEVIDNRVPDVTEDPATEAKAAVEAAEKAAKALDEAIANAEKNPDGSLKDEAALKAQQDEANALKEAAKEAIAKVTDDAQK
ncbi:hypothetical protein NSA18_12595, partial [Pasteurella caecimuris]|nr:hypothetical protein [Pasteurella caecimuris]